MPDRMTYARLGKTGFLVSRVSLGGYANHGQKANAGTIRQSWNDGMTTLDVPIAGAHYERDDEGYSIS
jgi:aryl-alcohol dehydrogenase-like predicted oxidoreductase